MDIVEETWNEIGRRVRPLKRAVFVRTIPPPVKTESGLIWLPPKVTSFSHGLPHVRVVNAIVLSAGPSCTVKPGELICFQRLHFARWLPLRESECFVGWIDESQLVGYVES